MFRNLFRCLLLCARFRVNVSEHICIEIHNQYGMVQLTLVEGVVVFAQVHHITWVCHLINVNSLCDPDNVRHTTHYVCFSVFREDQNCPFSRKSPLDLYSLRCKQFKYFSMMCWFDEVVFFRQGAESLGCDTRTRSVNSFEKELLVVLAVLQPGGVADVVCRRRWRHGRIM